MLGIIAKVLLFLALVAGGIAFALNATDAATWGTISFSQPDRAPCRAYADRLKSKPVLVEVRWIWSARAYGWGCYLEFSDDSKGTVTPMPNGDGVARFE